MTSGGLPCIWRTPQPTVSSPTHVPIPKQSSLRSRGQHITSKVRPQRQEQPWKLKGSTEAGSSCVLIATTQSTRGQELSVNTFLGPQGIACFNRKGYDWRRVRRGPLKSKMQSSGPSRQGLREVLSSLHAHTKQTVLKNPLAAHLEIIMQLISASSKNWVVKTLTEQRFKMSLWPSVSSANRMLHRQRYTQFQTKVIQ